MIYGSVCSGIEAATVAWHPLGWTPAWFAEIEAFPSAVLAHHYGSNLPGEPPAANGVPNLGDFTRIGVDIDATGIGLLVGGTPCQDFSVAGLRAGLAGDRGQLTVEFVRLLGRLRPAWFVWENVPGVLSDDGGRSFGLFLGLLAERGYGFAYRVLDAQHFGLAQRRERVFVVGYLGDWRPAAAVLFEPESLSGHPAPRREAGADITGPLAASAGSRGHPSPDDACNGGLIARPLTTRPGSRHAVDADTYIAHALRADGFDASEDGTGRGTPLVPVGFQCHGSNVGEVGTMRAGNGNETGGVPCIAFQAGQDPCPGDLAPSVATGRPGGAVAMRTAQTSANGQGLADECAHAVDTVNGQAVAFAQNQRDELRTMDRAGALSSYAGIKQQTFVATEWAVRRLTPTECERLQGFLDGYTLIPWPTAHRKPDDLAETAAYLIAAGWPEAEARDLARTPDGPRYKALGNAMAVPVMRWLGERIDMVAELIKEREAA